MYKPNTTECSIPLDRLIDPQLINQCGDNDHPAVAAVAFWI